MRGVEYVRLAGVGVGRRGAMTREVRGCGGSGRSKEMGGVSEKGRSRGGWRRGGACERRGFEQRVGHTLSWAAAGSVAAAVWRRLIAVQQPSQFRLLAPGARLLPSSALVALWCVRCFVLTLEHQMNKRFQIL
ncbi:hypothetical protein E2C01_033452 [Portunus trituberculatus]|uniref:Uncharacterized protein n=1 Tax=Portunus trituberculatus TaxID=210409 RepID=A0A5B7F3S3_PORTR|nr:hypothetical protein [Portunus trituberculatus]